VLACAPLELGLSASKRKRPPPIGPPMTKMPKNIRVEIQSQGRTVKIPSEAALETQFEPYAAEIGKVVFAWNRLHEKLARLCCVASGIIPGGVSRLLADPLQGSAWHLDSRGKTPRVAKRAKIA
jgi:hypothetical protein